MGIERARISSLLLLVVLLIPCLPPVAEAQTEYQERFARAAAYEREGRYQAAAAELAPLQHEYPDDYAVALQLAWLRYQAQDYAAAADDYRRAEAISRGSEEARLGLGWSLLQQGSADEAARLFRAILAGSPDHERAREGLALAEERIRIGEPATSSVRADFAYVQYQDHPERSSAWSFLGGFGNVAADVVAWDLTYRFARFQGKGAGGGSGNANGRSWSQHEVYALLGYTRPRFGLHAHFAYVRDEVEFADDLFAVGLSGRLSTLGRLWVEASLSFYPDDRIFRLSPSWRLSLWGAWYVEPGGALQVTWDGEVLGNGTLELGREWKRGSLRLGGKYGRERQPLYLHMPLMLNLRDEVKWGVWAGGSIHLSRAVELRLTYELNRLDPFSSPSAGDANMHVMAATVRGSF